jgi:hypothetical protein
MEREKGRAKRRGREGGREWEWERKHTSAVTYIITINTCDAVLDVHVHEHGGDLTDGDRVGA